VSIPPSDCVKTQKQA